jgi:hypothetical protein
MIELFRVATVYLLAIVVIAGVVTVISGAVVLLVSILL